MKNFSLLLILSITFFGCAGTNEFGFSPKPSWLVDASYIKDKLSAVGCANIHIDGEAAQIKLATQRAIEQIALQKTSKVSVVSYRSKSSYKSDSELSSLQEVNEQSIKTKVIDSYKDQDSKICVLVVEE